MKKEHQAHTNIDLLRGRPVQAEMDKLFDSSQWESCAALYDNYNYNHIYFHNWFPLDQQMSKDYMSYQDGHIKPGYQLLYLEKNSDGTIKAVEFDGLNIYAIEQYELDKYRDGYTIHFRCKTTLAIYTLYYPNSLYFEDQTDVESSEYADLAWKDIITEEELEQRKGWTRIYNSRITKLTKLG